MIIKESFNVKASLQDVWNFMTEPQNMAKCFPGCEHMEIVDERNFLVTVKVKVGFIAVRFDLSMSIDEMTPPSFVRIQGTGDETDKKGYLQQTTTVEFATVGDGETQVLYTCEVFISGRLATFGEAVMRIKAKSLGVEFVEAVKKGVESLKTNDQNGFAELA